jgi:hypothetical protein
MTAVGNPTVGMLPLALAAAAAVLLALAGAVAAF